MARKRKEVTFTKQELQDYCNPASNVTMITLAAKYGVSRETVGSRLRDLNDPKINDAIWRNRDKSNFKMTDSVLALIIEDYKTDMPMGDIADKYHMTAPTINKYLRLQGIPVRNRKAKKVTPVSNSCTAKQVKIPKTVFTIPHRMMTIGMRQQQCRA